MPALAESTDLELLALAQAGQRGAYGQLVARHQTLVASVAYGICGDFRRSQDIAQEAFVSAWQQLGSLEDAAKFKSWLCGITRNLSHNLLRQQARRPDQPVATADGTLESADESPGPRDQAVTREEAALVWQSLETLPEAYREPLILFYREHQSIERVAAALDLSEDTVKQRLSRGRGLLRDQVEHLIERSLGRTNPGVLFTTTVIAALPVAAVQIAVTTAAGAAAKGGTAAKTAGALSWLAPMLAMPFISLLSTAIQSRLAGRYNHSPEDRKFMQRLIWSTGLVSTFVLLALVGLNWWQFRQARNHVVEFSAPTFSLLLLGLLGIAVLVPLAIFLRHGPRYLELARNAQPPPNTPPWIRKFTMVTGRALIYRSPLTLFGLPLIDIRFGHSAGQPLVRGTAVGWIALGDIAYGVVFAVGGFAVSGIALGGIALGAFSTGYLAVGLVAIGGVAVGGLAKGVLVALGYVAVGSIAVGWEAAGGILTVARHVASGALSFAAQTRGLAAHGWEETNPLVRAFKPGLVLAISFPALANAIIALVGLNALARHRRDPASPAQASAGAPGRSALKPAFLGLLALALAGYALLLNAAVGRAAREIAEEREVAAYAHSRYEQGREFLRTGKSAEALAEFLWCLEEEMRHGRDLQHTGAIYSSIAELSRSYPPAKAVLRARRDRAEAAVRAGRADTVGIYDVWEVVILNNYLREQPRSRVLYDKLPPGHGLRPMLGRDLSLEP